MLCSLYSCFGARKRRKVATGTALRIRLTQGSHGSNCTPTNNYFRFLANYSRIICNLGKFLFFCKLCWGPGMSHLNLSTSGQNCVQIQYLNPVPQAAEIGCARQRHNYSRVACSDFQFNNYSVMTFTKAQLRVPGTWGGSSTFRHS